MNHWRIELDQIVYKINFTRIEKINKLNQIKYFE